MFDLVRFRFGKQSFDLLVLFGSGRTVKHCFSRSLPPTPNFDRSVNPISSRERGQTIPTTVLLPRDFQTFPTALHRFSSLYLAQALLCQVRLLVARQTMLRFFKMLKEVWTLKTTEILQSNSKVQLRKVSNQLRVIQKLVKKNQKNLKSF